jgi:hypothetical protein
MLLTASISYYEYFLLHGLTLLLLILSLNCMKSRITAEQKLTDDIKVQNNLGRVTLFEKPRLGREVCYD